MRPRRYRRSAARRCGCARARGNLEGAAAGYASALATWQQLSMVVETGFAQLGLGRTLVGLDRMEKAAESLAAARSIFTDLQAAPAIAEIDNLLSQRGSQRGRKSWIGEAG